MHFYVSCAARVKIKLTQDKILFGALPKKELKWVQFGSIWPYMAQFGSAWKC
jgi:hypothetical protein